MIDQHLPSQESWNRLHEVNFLFLQLALFPYNELLLAASEKILSRKFQFDRNVTFTLAEIEDEADLDSTSVKIPLR